LPTYGDSDLDETALFEAVHNLHRINLVGTNEKFEHYLVVLAYYMGWQPPQIAPQKNLSQQKYIIDPRVEGESFEAYLKKLTTYDQRLYQNALEIFERDVQNLLQLVRNRRHGEFGEDALTWDAFEKFVRQIPASNKPPMRLRSQLSNVKRFVKSVLNG
jgi:hypothetical protein